MKIFLSLMAVVLFFESVVSWGVFAHAVREGNIQSMVATAILAIICVLLSVALAWDVYKGNTSE